LLKNFSLIVFDLFENFIKRRSVEHTLLLNSIVLGSSGNPVAQLLRIPSRIAAQTNNPMMKLGNKIATNAWVAYGPVPSEVLARKPISQKRSTPPMKDATLIRPPKGMSL
jgi:hypothetical protein